MMLRKKSQAALIGAGLLAALCWTTAWAAPGDLDLTFGGTGKVNAAFGPLTSDNGSSVVVQPDGKILLGGTSSSDGNADFALARFNADGTPDPTFGTGGKVTTPVGSGNDYGAAVALQADGKIVLGGTSSNGSDLDFALVRYHDDGSPDSTFGTAGKVVTPIGSGDDNGRALAVQPDGKIVLAGDSFTGSEVDFAAIRYNDDGMPDPTFGTDGKVVTSIVTGDDRCRSIALQVDGKILLCGESLRLGGNYDFALVRLKTDGALDTTFSDDGKLADSYGSSFDFGRSVAVQGNGRILVGGYSGDSSNAYNFSIARYGSGGGLDGSFSGDGKVTISISAGSDIGASLALQSDGKIVLGGYSVMSGTDHDFTVARFLADGTPDASFSGDGVATTSFGLGIDAGASVAVQADGKILLGGYATLSGKQNFALARYSNGSQPPQVQASKTLTLTEDDPNTPLLLSAPTDADGDPLTITVDTIPNAAKASVLKPGGGIVAVGNTLTSSELTALEFDPAANAYGSAGQFQYTVTDGQGSSASQTVTLEITAVNDAPTAGGNAYTVAENGTLDQPAPGVLDNDSDVDDGLGALTSVAATGPSHGTLTLFGDGSFLYQPDANYHGPDSFTYRAQDAAGAQSAPATVNLTVTPTNHAPVAHADGYTGWRNLPLQVPAYGVLANDTDGEGQALTAVVVQNPTGGTLVLNTDGSFRYTPNAGTTSDSFTYKARDTQGADSGAVTVTLTLQADTTPPTAQVNGVVTVPGTPARVYVSITLRDIGSGVGRALLTSNSTNVKLINPATGQEVPVGGTLTFDPSLGEVVVHAEKLVTSQSARVELRVWDLAGNEALGDPVVENLEVKKRQITRTFKQLPQAEHYVMLENGTPGLSEVKLWVNGKRIYAGAVADGAVVRLNAAEQMRAGNRNTVKLVASGPAGATAVLLIGDASLAGGGAARPGRAASQRHQLVVPQK